MIKTENLHILGLCETLLTKDDNTFGTIIEERNN